MNATTLGSILMEATDGPDGASKKGSSGSFSRKIGSALKALSDFDVLSNWIVRQVDLDLAKRGPGLPVLNRDAEIEV